MLKSLFGDLKLRFMMLKASSKLASTIIISALIICIILGLVFKISNCGTISFVCLWIAFVLFLIISAINTKNESDDDAYYDVDNPQYKSHIPEEDDYKTYILVLLAEVLKANADPKDAELEKVNKTIRRYYRTEKEQTEAQDKFKVFLKFSNRVNLHSVCNKINNKIKPMAKSELLMELLAVVYADDTFDTNEEEVIKEIAVNLCFSPEEYTSTYVMFMRKYHKGLYNKSSQKKMESTNDQSSEINSKREYILILLGEMMKADERLMSCELDIVKSIIRRFYKKKQEQTEALKQFQNILNKKYDIQDICNQLNCQISYNGKIALINDLLTIAYADVQFQESEDNLIKRISNLLNISDNDYIRIYQNFKKTYDKEKKKKESSDNSNKKNYSSHTNDNSSDSNSDNHKERDEMSGKDAYTILCVDSNAPDSEVKKAYRAMAVKYHPDNAAALGDEAIRQATETMKQINAAWETVKEMRGIK